MDNNNNTNVKEKIGSSDKKENRILMGILAYIGFLVLVPFFVAKKDPFVKFHIKQGLVLFAIEIIIYILGRMFWSYSMFSLIQLLNLAVVIFSILGIINVVQNREKELPLIGQFSRYFSF